MNSLAVRKIDRLAKHLGCIAFAAEVGQHDITDMAALALEPVVQRESDRDAADQVPVNLGGEKISPGLAAGRSVPWR